MLSVLPILRALRQNTLVGMLRLGSPVGWVYVEILPVNVVSAIGVKLMPFKTKACRDGQWNIVTYNGTQSTRWALLVNNRTR